MNQINKVALTLISLSLSSSLIAKPANGYSTNNGRITQISSGNEQIISLHGSNWFGFNTDVQAPHGLWGGQSGDYVTSQVNTDLRTMIDRMKGLGFNAVRLPVVFDFILSPNGYPNIQVNPGCPYSPNKGEENIPNPNPKLNGQGCNTYFAKSGYEQNGWGYLQYVVEQFSEAGIYVLIDDHYEETVYPHDRATWLKGWEKIAKQFKNNPYVIGYDVFNEPDSKGINWATWGPDAVEAAKLLYSISPDKLIFIEGVAQGDFGANWGTGFQTEGLSDDDQRNPKKYFFENLFKAEESMPGLLDQIVISPHIYGMGGTNGQANPALYDKIDNYDKIFGYLNKSGINGKINGEEVNHVFPLAIGEFGASFGQYADNFAADGDERVMNIIGAYFRNENFSPNGDDADVQAGNKYYVKESVTGKTDKHNRIHDYFYWSWNPNSGNTGGILGSWEPTNSSLNQGNWTDVVWKKVYFLEHFLDHQNTTPSEPVNGNNNEPVKTEGKLCVSIHKNEDMAPGLTPAYFNGIKIQGQEYNGTLYPVEFDQAVCETLPTGNYTVSSDTLYGYDLEYRAPQQSAEVTENNTTTKSFQYQSYILENVEIRLQGLTGHQTAWVKFENLANNDTEEHTLKADTNLENIHLDPGSYQVTAQDFEDLNVNVTPSTITIEPGKFKETVSINYTPIAVAEGCAITFKSQGGEPNQWWPNAQYTFQLELTGVDSPNASTDWSVYVQYGDDVIGLDNFWNMKNPGATDKPANSQEPYSFTIKPDGNWQTLGRDKPVKFDEVGFIEKLNWRDNFTLGVNTIPQRAVLTWENNTMTCQINLAD